MKARYSSVSVAFTFVCLWMLGVHALQYSDIEMLGVKTCPMKDSCRQIGNASFFDRNCECDSQCAHYDDCCIDALAPRTRLKTKQICMAYGESYTGVYAIGRCPSNFVGPIEIVSQCQNNNLSDPVLSAPVTDTRNRRTYLNQYCALCNDASLSQKHWRISVDCDVPSETISNYTYSDLVYQSRRWSVRRHGRTYPCDLIFHKPADISNGLRFCRANLISTCHPQWQRQAHIRACRSYTSVVITDDELIYRNPHCAVCNNHSVQNITCFSSFLSGRKKKPFSFALLLDINQSDGDLVGISRPAGESCPGDEKYDPFFKKCRPIVCAIPGYSLVNGKCVKT